MNARITAIGIVAAIFSLVSTVAYIIVINIMSDNIEKLEERAVLMEKLTEFTPKSPELEATEKLVGALDSELIEPMKTAYATFIFIQVLCVLNLMFFLQHFISLIFVKKMGRFFEFPTF